MDAEEHSVIMQQVKELEVRSETVSPQDAAARGGESLHRGGAGGLQFLPAPVFGLWAMGCPGLYWGSRPGAIC